jgi:hypothetical protein
MGTAEHHVRPKTIGGQCSIQAISDRCHDRDQADQANGDFNIHGEPRVNRLHASRRET